MGLFDKVTNALGGNSTEESVDDSADNSRGAFDIPEWAVKDRVNVEKRTAIIFEHYNGVNKDQARIIAEALKENMEDTEGYSQDAIFDVVKEKVAVEEELLRTIVWTEMASIEMIDRVKSYLERERGGEVYEIQAPMDNRTHPVTKEAVEEIEKRGGAVSIAEIAEILRNKAQKYADDGGTPERMDHWVPHEKFRFTIIQSVDF